MRLIIHGPGLGKVAEVTPDLVVVCTDNGTPVAVASNVGANIAIRTAAHSGFGETLRLLGLGMAAPKVETVKTGEM